MTMGRGPIVNPHASPQGDKRKNMQPKQYQTNVLSSNEFADVPGKAVFQIDEATAREIVRLSDLVKANKLYRVELCDYRVNYLKSSAEDDDDSSQTASPDDGVRTECDCMSVSDTEFWFSALKKNSDVEFICDRQSIQELSTHFGLTTQEVK
jgi:hypothetical protein